jgi:hypothetical protein
MREGRVAGTREGADCVMLCQAVVASVPVRGSGERVAIAGGANSNEGSNSELLAGDADRHKRVLEGDLLDERYAGSAAYVFISTMLFECGLLWVREQLWSCFAIGLLYLKKQIPANDAELCALCSPSTVRAVAGCEITGLAWSDFDADRIAVCVSPCLSARWPRSCLPPFPREGNG